MKAFVTRICLVMVVLSLPVVAAAQSAPSPVVTLIPTKGRGGPRLDRQMKLLEPAIKEQAAVVSYRLYRKTAKKLRIRGRKIASIESVRTIGRELNLTHAIIIEGKAERVRVGKRRKKVYSAMVTVVALDTGENVFTQNYVLKGRKLTANVASQIAQDVLMNMVPPPPPPEPVAEPEPPPPPPAAEPPPVVEEPPPPEPEPIAIAPLPEPKPVFEPPPPPKKSIRAKWRPALHFRLGAIGSFRHGRIRDKTPTEALTYEPSGSLLKPSPMALAQLEFFPLAFGGNGSWYEGLGIDGEGIYTKTVTQIASNPKTEVKSTIVGANGGLVYRLVLWNSKTAADFKLRAGYGIFRFPLAKGSFPGVRYSGIYAGGTFTLPIVESLQIVVSGRYEPKVTLEGRIKNLGSSSKSAYAWHAEGGLRLIFDMIEVGLLGRYDHYFARYKDQSTLDYTSQYLNAAFQDAYTGALLTVGIQL
ncbi:MAG: hypothetical protein JW841_09360 [Deltaproteobacteria bacterium]|nr:hypothetical protein [Deltaproteobacteria bacterium]